MLCGRISCIGFWKSVENRMSEEAFSYEYRWAGVHEWVPAMDMIWRTFQKFEGDVYTEEGIQNFYDFITDGQLYRAFLNGSYRMMVALDKGRIIGVASVRNRNHLSLLFVEEVYHRRGVGRGLLERLSVYLKTQMNESILTVKASPYAVEFYKKVGFQITAPEECISGMLVTAMQKELK